MRVFSFIASIVIAQSAFAAASLQKAEEKLNDAKAVFLEHVSNPAESIPDSLLAKAQCVLVIPDVLKGGFIIGARGGSGVASCRTVDGWSQPAFYDLGGLSVGLQIGVQSTDLVLVFT